MTRFKNYINDILKSWSVNKEFDNQIKVNTNNDSNEMKHLEEKICELQEE